MKDWRKDNPAREVKVLAGGEHEPWPAEVREKALEAAFPTLQLAFVTGLCSGAHISDVIRMQYGWRAGSMMQFTTKKRVGKRPPGVEVAVPMHQLWLDELAKVERKAVTLIYDLTGKSFSNEKILQERIRRLVEEIGCAAYMSNGRECAYSFHGSLEECCLLPQRGGFDCLRDGFDLRNDA